MPRTDRLYDITRILQDGALHRAGDLAVRLGVSVRTLYRDMDTLAASGIPVEGTRGTGYRLADVTVLPSLSLTAGEMEALNLGLAIVGEAPDADLKGAAASLAEKIDALLPERGIAPAEAWKFATSPFSNTARAIRHIPTIRAAVRARQKLRLTYTTRGGEVTARRVRPLALESLGRMWTLTAWCELREGFRVFRLDLMESAQALPELFVDEPGRTLADYPG